MRNAWTRDRAHELAECGLLRRGGLDRRLRLSRRDCLDRRLGRLGRGLGNCLGRGLRLRLNLGLRFGLDSFGLSRGLAFNFSAQGAGRGVERLLGLLRGRGLGRLLRFGRSLGLRGLGLGRTPIAALGIAEDLQPHVARPGRRGQKTDGVRGQGQNYAVARDVQALHQMRLSEVAALADLFLGQGSGWKFKGYFLRAAADYFRLFRLLGEIKI